MINKMTIEIIAFSLAFFFLSCSSSNKYIEEKMNAPLKQKIATLDESSNNEIISVIGKCNTSITDEMRNKMLSTGVSVESVINEIFTVSGNKEAIKNLAELDFVIHIELSVPRDININQ
jgi:hypothetical protein